MQFDRIAASCAALAIIGLVVFLLVMNQPIADPRLFFAFRVVLSLSAAVLGAAIPGFLEIGWTGRGLAIRAGGALALFLLTFLFTPDLAETSKSAATSVSAPGGVAAQTITGSPITIHPPPAGR